MTTLPLNNEVVVATRCSINLTRSHSILRIINWRLIFTVSLGREGKISRRISRFWALITNVPIIFIRRRSQKVNYKGTPWSGIKWQRQSLNKTSCKGRSTGENQRTVILRAKLIVTSTDLSPSRIKRSSSTSNRTSSAILRQNMEDWTCVRRTQTILRSMTSTNMSSSCVKELIFMTLCISRLPTSSRISALKLEQEVSADNSFLKMDNSSKAKWKFRRPSTKPSPNRTSTSTNPNKYKMVLTISLRVHLKCKTF